MTIELTKLENKWIQDNLILLKTMYPKVDENKLKQELLNILESNIKNTNLSLNDTYRHKIYSTTTREFPEYCDIAKPTLGGNGVLFDRNAKNPAIKMLDKIADKRKEYKKMMYQCDPSSYEFTKYDLYQNNEKTKINAWYGINGSRASLFYNLEAATAITGKGRHLISIATCAFDRFLGNHLIFLDFNDCVIFIKNIISEETKFNIKDYIDKQVDEKMVYNKLYEMFDNKDDCNHKILNRILRGLNKEQLTRIYYKNDLEKFSLNSIIKDKWLDIVTCVDTYVNPSDDKTPEHLKNKLNDMWDLLHEFVLYDYPIIDKTYRVINKPRKRVLVIDTDSNMIHLDPWLKFVKENIIPEEILKTKEDNKLDYVIIYTLCNILSKMIQQVLATYLRHCNVREDKIKLLDMKNEYLFLRMLITSVKKNYASRIQYKEGKFMNGKLDIKGLPIYKSSTNRVAASYFKKILENDILLSEKIDVVQIMIKLYKFQNEIKASLENGEVTFLKPVNIKDVEAYDDPLKISGYRGAMIWNLTNPNNEITLPDSFFLLKMTLNKRDQLEEIEDENIRKLLDENIFLNPEKRISSKGVYVLGIPRDAQIPDWAIPFIDVDTIINDTMKSFMSVIKALGVKTIQKNSQTEQFSNYISL